MAEFRQLGWSNRAAVCLAVEKTGNVITAAGLIMSISFAGEFITLIVYLRADSLLLTSISYSNLLTQLSSQVFSYLKLLC